jgi:hypothetical protein
MESEKMCARERAHWLETAERCDTPLAVECCAGCKRRMHHLPRFLGSDSDRCPPEGV